MQKMWTDILREGERMYGKHFASTYTGSMIGAGLNVFAVWGYIIANTVKSYVELNPRLLAMLLGGSEEEIQKAVSFLEQPDPKSRYKDHEGRRIVKEGEYLYFVPAYQTYRSLMNEDERREYNRIKQAEHRAKLKDVKCQGEKSTVSAHTDTDTEAYTKEECPKTKFSDTHLAVAKLLEEEISERMPKYKLKHNHLEKWANEVRLMEEKKEATLGEIEKIINWLRTDDFWYKNVLSMEKLRKQFGRLWEEANNVRKKKRVEDMSAQEFEEIQEEALRCGGPHPDRKKRDKE